MKKGLVSISFRPLTAEDIVIAAKNAGLIGVRYEPHHEFGPTAESFKSTNIIGKIVSDTNGYEDFKEGVVIYVRESMS